MAASNMCCVWGLWATKAGATPDGKLGSNGEADADADADADEEEEAADAKSAADVDPGRRASTALRVDADN